MVLIRPNIFSLSIEEGPGKLLALKKKDDGQPGKRAKLRSRDPLNYQKWIRGEANSDGWFTLKNTKSKNLLTADKFTKVAGNSYREI